MEIQPSNEWKLWCGMMFHTVHLIHSFHPKSTSSSSFATSFNIQHLVRNLKVIISLFSSLPTSLFLIQRQWQKGRDIIFVFMKLMTQPFPVQHQFDVLVWNIITELTFGNLFTFPSYAWRANCTAFCQCQMSLMCPLAADHPKYVCHKRYLVTLTSEHLILFALLERNMILLKCIGTVLRIP